LTYVKRTASGYDNIPHLVYKQSAFELTFVIVYLVNKTIDVKNVGKIIKNVKKRKKRYKNKKR